MDSAIDCDDAYGRATLESWLGSNLFAFFAVAYLGSLLAQTIRTKGVELEQKSEALKDLQAFNQDIIESMRGGLLTTDLEGRILLINRAGAEITGHGFGLMRGENVADALPGFWPVEVDEHGNPLAMRKEIEFRTPAGETRFLGISISPLRTGTESDQWVRIQFSRSHGVEASGARNRHEGTHGGAWPAFGRHRPRDSPTSHRDDRSAQGAGPAGAAGR